MKMTFPLPWKSQVILYNFQNNPEKINFKNPIFIQPIFLDFCWIVILFVSNTQSLFLLGPWRSSQTMITDLYDEFGNYIGPEVNDSESESPVQSVSLLSLQNSPYRSPKTLRRNHWSSMKKKIVCFGHGSPYLFFQNRSNDWRKRGRSRGGEGLQHRHHSSRGKAVLPWCRRSMILSFRASTVQVYGDAEVLVQEEDEQDISVPLIAPIDTKTFSLLEKTIPVTNVWTFSSRSNPSTRMNIMPPSWTLQTTFVM